MKKLFIFFIVIIMMTMSVAAFRDVDCDNGLFNTDVCRQGELDDEFDQLDRESRNADRNLQQQIYSNDRDIVDVESVNRQQNRAIDRVRSDSANGDAALRIEIGMNTRNDMQQHQDAKDYSDVNDRRVVAISNQGDEDVMAYSDKNDMRVVGYVNTQTQNAKTYADEHDSKGTSWSRVEGHLYDEFITFLKGIFTTIADYKELQDRTDRLEARVIILEHELGTAANVDSMSIDCLQAKIQSARTNTTSTVNGVTFVPTLAHMGCTKFESVN